MMLRTYYASSQDAKQRAVPRGTATQRTEAGVNEPVGSAMYARTGQSLIT